MLLVLSGAPRKTRGRRHSGSFAGDGQSAKPAEFRPSASVRIRRFHPRGRSQGGGTGSNPVGGTAVEPFTCGVFGQVVRIWLAVHPANIPRELADSPRGWRRGPDPSGVRMGASSALRGVVACIPRSSSCCRYAHSRPRAHRISSLSAFLSDVVSTGGIGPRPP